MAAFCYGHRLKNVCHADQILVIDHGRIVQQGKQEQLIHEPGIYADFVGGKKTGRRLETVNKKGTPVRLIMGVLF